MKQPRHLCVLDINDNPQKMESRYFHVRNISSFNRAQREQTTRNDGFRPDIILGDVSMDRDDEVREAWLKKDPHIIPIGPLLALPYLRSRDIIGFAPYSAHMEDEHLLRAPYFLMAMALIASKLYGRTFTSVHLHGEVGGNDSLRSVLRKLAPIGDARLALRFGLRAYRRSFKLAVHTKRVRVLNGPAIAELFSRMHAELDRGASRVVLPREAGVEFVGPSGIEVISLRSLFADHLRWVNGKLRKTTLSTIESTWCRLLGDSEGDPLFQMAHRVMRLRDRGAEELGDNQLDAWKLIQSLYRDQPGTVHRQVLRLCVLFANAAAWQDEARFQRSTVHRILTKGQYKTYWAWFGRRSMVNSKPIVEFLQPKSNAEDRNECYLGAESRVDEDDDQRIRLFLAAEDYSTPYRLPYKVV